MKCHEICQKKTCGSPKTFHRTESQPRFRVSVGGSSFAGTFKVRLLVPISKEGLLNCAKIRLNSLNIHPFDPDSFLEWSRFQKRAPVKLPSVYHRPPQTPLLGSLLPRLPLRRFPLHAPPLLPLLPLQALGPPLPPVATEEANKRWLITRKACRLLV